MMHGQTKIKLKVCVCSLSYSACNAPYCHLWPVRLFYIFPTLSHKRQDFRNKFIAHEMCVSFSLQGLSKIFLIEKIIWWDTVIKVYRPSYKVLVLGWFWSNLDFSDIFFKNCSNTKFHENPSRGSRIVPCGETDGRTGRHTSLKQLVAPTNFAKAPKDPCYTAGKQTMPDVAQLPLNCLRQWFSIFF